MTETPRVVCLAGGVGGAKLAEGLQARVGNRLTVVVNTGDDVERHGLLVMPDHDTVMYTLAGIEHPEHGWGLRDETWNVLGALERLGEETWFRLGDGDIAVHLARHARLAAGAPLTEACLALQRSLGVRARILPMTDDRVRTRVRTDDGWLDFQDYFVRRRQAPEVREVAFDGVAAARPTLEVLDALDAAGALVIAPSNPLVSIAPILALPGMTEALLALRNRGVPVVAVSGIVGGRALKGPADRMLASLGHEASALGVARGYAGLAHAFVLDAVDAALAPAVEALGVHAVVADTIMTDDAARARVAGEVLRVAARLAGREAQAFAGDE